MTDERTLSRRDSLKGIATTGALIGGAGIGLGTASAQETDDHGVAQVTFQQCHSLYVLLEDTDSLPTNVWIRTYNAERERFENVVKPITGAHVTQFPAIYGDYYVAEFNVFQFYNRTPDDGDEIVSVTVGDETLVNPNECSSVPNDDSNDYDNGNDHNGYKNGDYKNGYKEGEQKKHGKKSDKKKGYGKGDSKDKTHKYDEKKLKEACKYDKKVHEKCEYGKKGDKGNGKGKYDDKKGKNGDDNGDNGDNDEPVSIDLDDIELIPECVDTVFGLARYRIENANDAPVVVDYDVHLSPEEGSIGIEANSATYFEVGATTSDGVATVQLRYNDAVVDNMRSNTDEECIPRGRIHLFVDSVDAENDEATFYIMNYNDIPRSVTVRIAGTDVEDIATVDPNSSLYFTITVPDGEATVELYYEGELLDAETSGAE
ncbi:hypothetical protein G6M89_03015 [Natronolimnobius sp. AArcel1]|uniref:hypothetical protein n=1 Tax=Natronolimnobius sp. AArcel1 TaxID=1679093 RepID=UPI0013EA227D|nr:hypothetical protein [Natronolimnobius sp. AArcel1]NGM67994.1 hypothetical protein [Natronolimnobius sp. AArcel1]